MTQLMKQAMLRGSKSNPQLRSSVFNEKLLAQLGLQIMHRNPDKTDREDFMSISSQIVRENSDKFSKHNKPISTVISWSGQFWTDHVRVHAFDPYAECLALNQSLDDAKKNALRRINMVRRNSQCTLRTWAQEVPQKTFDDR